MRSANWFSVVVAVVTTFAVVARAEDPPPAKAKHENKVTPEAMAAIERFKSLVYRPRDHGLTSLECSFFPQGFERHERPTIRYTAADGLSTVMPQELIDEKERLGLVGNLMDYPLSRFFDPADLFYDGEHDAVIVGTGTDATVDCTSYVDGVEKETSSFRFGASGLVERLAWRAHGEDARGGYVATYSWGKLGDLHCVEAVDIALATSPPSHYEFRFHRTDARGITVLAAYDVTYFLKDGAARTFTFHAADLVVNGKAVELPKPWKHVNQVTPEATAAMARYARLSYRPTEHGLASVTGTFFHPASGREPKPYTFEFKAGARVEVHGGPDADPVPERDRMTRFMMAIPLHAALAGVLLVEGDEYDARVVERQGTNVLVVTTYADGVVGRSDEFTFDAEGLVATAAIDVGSTGIRPVATVRMAWERRGALRRISAIDFGLAWPAESNPVRYRYELTYTDVDGIDVVSSYTVHPGTARDGFSPGGVTMRLEDLVVNGKAVAAPQAPGGK